MSNLPVRGQRTIGIVGHYRSIELARPVNQQTYVSVRALPWHQRRSTHVAAIATGSVLLFGSITAWAIMSIGLPAFLATTVGAPLATWVVAKIVQSRSVRVTTTTTTKVRM